MSKLLKLPGHAGIQLRDALNAGVVSLAELEALKVAPEEVWAIKSDTSSMQLKAVTKAAVKTEEARTFRFVYSDERVDRHGDIIMAKGWDVVSFAAASGPILWGHNHSAPPIGLSSKPKNANVDGIKSLVGDVTFAEAEVNPDADLIWRLIDAGFLKTGSVGFRPIEAKFGDEISEKERLKLGLSQYGMLFTLQELLEFSIVSVPANPGARQIERGLKMLLDTGAAKDADIARLIKTYPLTEEQARDRVKDAVRSFTLLSSDIMADLRGLTDKEEAESHEEAGETANGETEPETKTLTEAEANAMVEKARAEWEAENAGEALEAEAPELVTSMAKLTDNLAGLTDSVALVLEAAAESTKANRQLADAVYDLTQRSSVPAGDDGTRGASPAKHSDDEGEPVTEEQVQALLKKLDSIGSK